MTEPKPFLSSGSLFNTSEGLLGAALATIVSSVVSGEYSDEVKMAAIAGLSVAVSAYSIARTLVKRNA